jgi:hypothetical protein
MPTARPNHPVHPAFERLRCARTAAAEVLGDAPVAERSDVLRAALTAPPYRYGLWGVVLTAVGAFLPGLGYLHALAAIVATAALSLGLGVWESRRPYRLARRANDETDTILSRLAVDAVARAGVVAAVGPGAIERAALAHAARERTFVARLAATRISCPECGRRLDGGELARRGRCPGCGSTAALERPSSAAIAPEDATALEAYARWAEDARAIARASEALRRIGDAPRAPARARYFFFANRRKNVTIWPAAGSKSRVAGISSSSGPSTQMPPQDSHVS